MEFKVKLSHLKISPRKTRLVADLIRGKNLSYARQQLQFAKKRSAPAILKLLDSALSNAKNINEKVNETNLFVKEIFVDEGPKLKRYRPRARGSAYEIQKKTSHITLVLSEKESKKPEAQNPKLEINLPAGRQGLKSQKTKSTKAKA